MAVLALGVAVTGLTLALPASAQDDHEDDAPPTTLRTPLPGEVGIGDGIFLTEAVITPPDGGEPRTLDAYDAAVFVQSWLATAFFGSADIVKDPPPELPVYRVDATGDFAGVKGSLTVYYVQDGTTPYVAFPGLQVWTEPDEAPQPSNWFVAPARVVDAFNGEGELIDTTGTQSVTSTTASGEEEASSPVESANSSSSAPWVAAGIAVAALLVGGGFWLRHRRAGQA